MQKRKRITFYEKMTFESRKRVASLISKSADDTKDLTNDKVTPSELEKARITIYRMYDPLCQYYDQMGLLNKVKDKMARKKKCTIGTFAWIVIVLLSFAGCVVITSSYSTKRPLSAWLILALIIGIWGGILALLYVCLKAIKLIIYVVVLKPRFKLNVRTYAEKVNALNHQIMNYYATDYKPALIIPANYQYPIAIDYIISCFENKRANSLKDAINLFEQQLHYWKVENSLQRIQLLQNQQNMILSETARAAKWAAEMATISAFKPERW